MYSHFKLPRIGFIGAGKLVEALTKGIVAAGVVQINQVYASAPRDSSLKWIQQLGSNVTTDNKQLLKDNKIIILAVKPLTLPKVLRQIAPEVTRDHLILSFAAGMKLRTMQYLLPPKTRIVRMMTNTPVQFREGVSSFTLGQYATDEDRELINKLMCSVGYCVETKEELMDTVTGFAGGGPAYVYSVVEAIADGAVAGGMRREDALQMSARAVLGAARMILETKLHPGELRDAVCSGGGSTIYGIHALEKGGVRGSIIDAVLASTNRSKTLGEVINQSSFNIKKNEETTASGEYLQ